MSAYTYYNIFRKKMLYRKNKKMTVDFPTFCTKKQIHIKKEHFRSGNTLVKQKKRPSNDTLSTLSLKIACSEKISTHPQYAEICGWE